MSNTARLDALRAKHIALDEQIHTEMQRPMPDTVAIQTLKKQKLQVKELMPA